MTYNPQLKDTQNIPIPQVYVPGIGFVALQGSAGITTDGSTNSSAAVMLSLSLGTALADWTSQPVQTAALGADTILKFGTAGTASPTHCSIQNNSGVNFYFSFDQDSTAATAKVYCLQPGQFAVFDRSFTQFHCHTPSQVSFGGSSGITVEAFA